MHQPYLSPFNPRDFERPAEIYLAPPLDEYPAPERDITFGKVLWHLFLLGLTAVTTTLIPTLLLFSGNLTSGILFSFTLLMILGAHEMGHYLAARLYGVRATLPYFLPAPLGIGTFGAFIKMKSAIPSKRALFDIGIAGPLAGFVFLIPAAIVGLYFANPAAPTMDGGEGFVFHDPLLFRALAKLMGVPRDIELNPFWFAAWAGCLVTSLNLLPVGQLDGGHVVYAAFGARWHWIIARVIYVGVILLTVVSYFWDGWMGWAVYVVILTLMLRIGHPRVMDEEESLGFGRKVVTAIGLLVFLLCFMPAPITF
ncbi:MAG TPA: site-2 protease family protein [Blastocatellia bacterium]|nr:site-2 protease family protein [Blastocatellia bacterium]